MRKRRIGRRFGPGLGLHFYEFAGARLRAIGSNEQLDVAIEELVTLFLGDRFTTIGHDENRRAEHDGHDQSKHASTFFELVASRTQRIARLVTRLPTQSFIIRSRMAVLVSATSAATAFGSLPI